MRESETQTSAQIEGLSRSRPLRSLTMLSLIFSVGVVAHVARWSRFQADDLCFMAWVKNRSVWDYQRTAYLSSTGRFTSSFFHITIVPHGSIVTAFLPIAFIILVLLALATPAISIVSWYNWSIPRGPVVAAVAIVGMALLFVLPDPVSSLYWPTAIVGYGFPIIFHGILITLLYRLSWRTRFTSRPWIGWVMLALLAAIAATFQEVSGFFGFTILITVLFVHRRRLDDDSRRLWFNALWALGGTFLGLAIDLAAPGNGRRAAKFDVDRSPLPVLYRSFRGSAAFLMNGLITELATLVLLGVAGFAIGRLLPGRRGFPSTFRAVALVGGWAYVTLAFMAAPNVYGKGKFPSAYAVIEVWLLILLVVLVIGVLLGGLGREGTSRSPQTQRLLLAVVMVALPGIAASIAVSEGVTLAERLRPEAEAWDMADQAAREQVRAGASRVTLDDDLSMGRDPISTAETNWVNECYAELIGADSVVRRG